MRKEKSLLGMPLKTKQKRGEGGGSVDQSKDFLTFKHYSKAPSSFYLQSSVTFFEENNILDCKLLIGKSFLILFCYTFYRTTINNYFQVEFLLGVSALLKIYFPAIQKKKRRLTSWG